MRDICSSLFLPSILLRSKKKNKKMERCRIHKSYFSNLSMKWTTKVKFKQAIGPNITLVSTPPPETYKTILLPFFTLRFLWRRAMVDQPQAKSSAIYPHYDLKTKRTKRSTLPRYRRLSIKRKLQHNTNPTMLLRRQFCRNPILATNRRWLISWWNIQCTRLEPANQR